MTSTRFTYTGVASRADGRKPLWDRFGNALREPPAPNGDARMLAIAMTHASASAIVMAAILAQAGYEVCVLDVDDERVAELSAGRLPVDDPELAALIDAQRRLGRLRFDTKLATVFFEFDLILTAIAEGEPDDARVGTIRVLKGTLPERLVQRGVARPVSGHDGLKRFHVSPPVQLVTERRQDNPRPSVLRASRHEALAR